MTKKYSSVIDVPKSAAEKDAFGMEKYTKGLIEFIENTATPITIALQGEWGSGKTSLMNTLKRELCDDEGKRFYPVWINTWQFSLMKDANETLVSIIKGLTEEVIALSKNKNSDNIKKLSKTFGKIFKATAKIAVNATTGQDIGEVFDAFAPENKEVTVLQLRDELNVAIKEIISEGTKDGFIFFIDDLDRIDPPVAVEILELLKNIFDLENCVFVLAIDYDVVIKGLEPKFGKFTEKNEREFRSFFDKIIQLPFSMPVSNYDIDDFLVEKLETIDYLDEELKSDDDFKSAVSEITRFSVGTNPRALKRLLNSLSLINSINKGLNENESEEDANKKLDKLINFALVNIQIAYPQFYRLLVQYPNFTAWNEKIAIQMNLPKLDDDIVEKLNAQEEFDEDWEKIVFRVCENDYYLKKKALNISRLLNKLRTIIEEEKENTGEIISQVISLSSVTNLEAFDSPVVDYHKPSLLKNIRDYLIESIEKKTDNVEVKATTKRVQSNAYFAINNDEWHIWSHSDKGKIIVHFFSAISLGWNEYSFEDNLKNENLKEEYDKVSSDFYKIINKFENIKTDKFKYEECENYYNVHFYFYVSLKNVDDFFEDDIIDEISNTIIGMHELIDKIAEMDKVFLDSLEEYKEKKG